MSAPSPLRVTAARICDLPFVAVSCPESGAVFASGFVPEFASADTRIEDTSFWQRLEHESPEIVARGLSPDRAGHVADALAAAADGDDTALRAVAVVEAASEFRRAVSRALRGVERGEVLSYSELAARVGRPSAVRAAGSACARNPVLLFVPCHRVVRSDGALGGYRDGVAVKSQLLRWEGAPGSGSAT